MAAWIRFRKGPRCNGLVICIFLLAALDLSAQSGPVSVRINPDKILAYTYFTMEFEVLFDEMPKPVLLEPGLPDGIRKVSGPEIRTRYINNSYLTTFKSTYIASQAGRYTLNKFTVKNNNEEYETIRPRLVILQSDEKNLEYPVIARWRADFSQVYTGQTIPVYYEIRNLTEIHFPTVGRFNQPANTLMEEAPDAGKIISEKIDSVELFHIPAKAWLITPTSGTQLRLPPTSCTIKGLRRESDAMTIEILPLPDEIKTSGAIGSFTIQYEIDKNSVQRDETLSFRIVIEGRGNMNYLQMPELDYRGLSLVSREETENLIPDSRGYKGSRSIVNNFKVSSNTAPEIRTKPYHWLDLADDAVKTEGAAFYTIGLEINNDENKNMIQQQKYTIDEILLQEVIAGWNSLSILFWILLPPAFLLWGMLWHKNHYLRSSVMLSIVSIVVLLFVFVPKKPHAIRENITGAVKAMESGNLGTAEKLYTQSIELSPRNAALRHNLGIVYSKMGKTGKAIHAFVQSLEYNENQIRPRASLDIIENRNKLNRQITRPARINTVLMYCLMVAAAAFCAFTGWKLYVSNDSRYLILTIVLASVFLALFSIHAANSLVSRSPKAVIATGPAKLRKIPDTKGQEGIELPEGTIVHVHTVTEDFIRIKTSYSLEGWLEEESVLKVK